MKMEVRYAAMSKHIELRLGLFDLIPDDGMHGTKVTDFMRNACSAMLLLILQWGVFLMRES